MNKFLYTLTCLLATVALISSCHDDETYAEQKERERKAIKSFLNRDVKIQDGLGEMVCNVGIINPISEAQFLAQDSTTDVSKNEYVCFASSGVYMQIVRKGVGEKIAKGESKRILCRFIEYNILADTLLIRNDGSVNYWSTNPDIMNVKNTSGTFSATFDTSVNGGGAMYLTYGDMQVPSGWLVPLSYINVGRQVSQDRIAKVRLIVPHTQGTTQASGNVYPAFYEILYQEMRE